MIFNKKKVICLWIVHHVPVCLPEGSGSVKSGGGGNAREIRIRKTKKKGRRDEDSDEETGPAQQSTLMDTQLLPVTGTTCLCVHIKPAHCNKSLKATGIETSPLGCSAFFMGDRGSCSVPGILINLCVTSPRSQ